jgi:hypothetical protein
MSETATGSGIGAPVRRREDLRLVRGGGRRSGAESTGFSSVPMDFELINCYVCVMAKSVESRTAARIRKMAREHHVAYVGTPRDAEAHHITRLADDGVEFDEIEQLLIALQRCGHLSRAEMVQLQAAYLREAKP